MKQKSVQSFVHERVEIPLVVKDKDGNATLLCPFCKPTHPLRADGATACGTVVRVQAVQTTYKAKYAKRNMVCVKCGKSGGEMVSWQGTAYIHVHDCMPGTVTLPEPPTYSKIAQLAYGLPDWTKPFTSRMFGKAMKVDEVDQNGNRTGVILGYAFVNEKK